jgi:hypothetical protein
MDRWERGVRCFTSSLFGPTGYEDIKEGALVVIADNTGNTLALTTLDAGAVPTGGSDTNRECAFPFEAINVSTGKGFYGITIGHPRHGEVLRGADSIPAADARRLTLKLAATDSEASALPPAGATRPPP